MDVNHCPSSSLSKLPNKKLRFIYGHALKNKIISANWHSENIGTKHVGVIGKFTSIGSDLKISANWIWADIFLKSKIYILRAFRFFKTKQKKK